MIAPSAENLAKTALSMFRRPAAKADNTGDQRVRAITRPQANLLFAIAKKAPGVQRLNPAATTVATYLSGDVIITIDYRSGDPTLFVQEARP